MGRSDRKCAQCLGGVVDHGFKHGKSGYDYHNCRCDVCRSAKSAIVVRRHKARYQSDPEYARRHRQYHSEYKKRVRERDGDAVRAKDRRKYAELMTRPGARQQERERRRASAARNPRRHRNTTAAAEVNRRWRAANKEYLRSTRRARDAALSRVPSPNAGRPWSSQEDALVMRDDITLVEMAYLVGRSASAVIQHRKILRLSVDALDERRRKDREVHRRNYNNRKEQAA